MDLKRLLLLIRKGTVLTRYLMSSSMSKELEIKRPPQVRQVHLHLIMIEYLRRLENK